MRTMTADWGRIGPLPSVSAWRKGQKQMSWQERVEKYASLSKAPAIVTATMATPIAYVSGYTVQIDSLLSAAALTDHPAPSHWDKVAIVPLPIDLVWVSPEGLPLWACTALAPVGDTADSREYWHKRYPTHRADLSDRQNANTSSGRWREYRTQISAQFSTHLQALVIGNIEECKRLLDGITHIGKKGGMGYGRVLSWSVTPSNHSIKDVLMARPVPIASGLAPVEGITEKNRGWTPPYWYAPHWSECKTGARLCAA
jgi:CRISPR type IV-associated protein Csf3